MRKVELVDPPALSTLPPPGLRRGRRSRRAVFLSWLRATHLYVGLWGATLGLLFGLTGILLNHRTILKIPVQQSVQRNVQLPLPAQPLETPEHLAAWLRSELKIAPERAATIKSQPPKSLVWADREVIQPERWTVGFYSPQHGIFAEYFVGNRSVRLDLLDATPIGP